MRAAKTFFSSCFLTLLAGCSDPASTPIPPDVTPSDLGDSATPTEDSTAIDANVRDTSVVDALDVSTSDVSDVSDVSVSDAIDASDASASDASDVTDASGRTCTPGAADCNAAGERRVCNADGTGYTTTACGAVLNGTGTCSAGACRITCSSGYLDCDGVASNGCEINGLDDALNCDVCGRACPSGQTCASAVCTSASSARLSSARYGLATATTPDGRVWVMGGYGSGSYLTDNEVYDPAANAWTRRASLPTGTSFAAAVTLRDGRILFVGGRSASMEATASVLAYTPTTDAWAPLTPLDTARAYAAATVGADGRVYVFCGTVATSEVYDPATTRWTPIRSPSVPRQGARAATAPDGRIYLFGGVVPGTSTFATSVEVYAPATDAWTAGPAMPAGRAYFGGAMGRDGRFYLVGGSTPASAADASGTAFNFIAGTFASIAPMSLGRQLLGAETLLDGRVLAMGGAPGRGFFAYLVEAYTPSSDTWH